MSYKPKAIEAEGLEAYLNRTATIHNNLGYNDFKQMLLMEIPKVRIAKKFKVEKSTVHRWLIVYEKEQGK